jgi:hypothetical protein
MDLFPPSDFFSQLALLLVCSSFSLYGSIILSFFTWCYSRYATSKALCDLGNEFVELVQPLPFDKLIHSPILALLFLSPLLFHPYSTTQH